MCKLKEDHVVEYIERLARIEVVTYPIKWKYKTIGETEKTKRKLTGVCPVCFNK